MWWFFVVLLVIVIATILELPRFRAVRPLYLRGCAGMKWRRTFPQSPANEIREFLGLFVDAFGFPKKHRLRFRPDDRVMDLYRALNPPQWSIGDNMELESLVEDFERRYGVDLFPLWHDEITLGEVFKCAGRN